MSFERIPDWAFHPVTADAYDAWPEERSAGVEMVDGMIRVIPAPSPRHTLIAERLAAAFGATAGQGIEIRLRDAPLLNRRPDVVVLRAGAPDVGVVRPEHVLLVAEIVSTQSATADRVHKPGDYAAAGIGFYWRVEGADTDAPVVFAQTLDPAGPAYRATEVFTGVVKATVPFAVEVDLRR